MFEADNRWRIKLKLGYFKVMGKKTINDGKIDAIDDSFMINALLHYVKQLG